MIPLLLSTLFSAAFGLVVRYAQRRNCNLLAVGAINYLTAALVHIALVWFTEFAAGAPVLRSPSFVMHTASWPVSIYPLVGVIQPNNSS